MSHFPRVLRVELVLTLMMASGAAAQQQTASKDPVWPAPPDAPRVRWVGALSSERQLGRKESFFARLKRSIAGTSITGVYELSRPYDVYARDSNRIYVTDGVTPTVVVFDRLSKRVEFLGADAPGGLRKPMGLGGDAAGNVYVADQVGRRVLVFDSSGHFVRTFGGRQVLLNPVDVAVDAESGRYYVVDSYLHQVVVFDAGGQVIARLGRGSGTADDSLRALEARFEPPGSGADGPDSAVGHAVAGRPHRAEGHDVLGNRGGEQGEFRYPVSATVGPDGSLYVVDQLNFRVQVFDRAGRFARIVGSPGTTPGSFARPKGVGVDSEGHLYVSDAAFNNVQIFDRGGELLLVVAEAGRQPGALLAPLGITVDAHDRIYVADRYNNRIATLEYLTTSGGLSGTPGSHP